MDGRAASLTVTDKIPYLLEAGISLTAISAVTGEKDTRFTHYQLLPWGPSGLRFDFRHLMARKYGKGWLYKILTPLLSLILLPFTVLERLLLGLSSQSSWALPAAFKGISLVRKGQANLVYSSAAAWSGNLAGWIIKKFTGVMWIAEIHDPMIIRDDPSDDGTRPRVTRDKRFLQRLEKMICRDADYVWWFTQGALHYAKLRNPELGDKGFVVFPGAEPPGCHAPFVQNKSEGAAMRSLNLCHFGSLAEDRSIAPVLRAMHEFFKTHPQAKEKIKIHVYGAALDKVSRQTIQELHMEANVIAHGRIENDPVTGKSGRERIMEIMRGADVLLLLHGDYEWCAEYIPSKSYDYYWSKSAIWGITNRNPELDEILQARNCYLSHTLDSASILNALELLWADWNNKTLRPQVFLPITPKDAVNTILQKIST